MSTHAKLSPSSAARWLRCPASVGFVDQLRAEGKIPAEERSEFTDEGTIAHEFAAKALEHFDAGLDFDWETIPDAVMRSHVRAYYDLVTSKVTGDGQLYVERRMPLFYGYRGAPGEQVWVIETEKGIFMLEDSQGFSQWPVFSTYEDAKAYFDQHLAPQGYWIEQCGTSDAIVLTDEALFIIDLKYGQGVSVEANDNDQLAIYAESFIRERGLRANLPPQFSVVPIIFQPRAREGAPVREWFTSLGELDEKATQMGAVARQIANQGDERVKRVGFCAGDKQCRFCPARKLCKHYADHCTLDVAVEFADCEQTVALDAPNELSEADIARIAKVALDGKFVKWLNAVADYALELRLAGKLEGSGLKAVYSTPRRQWTDEDAAAKLLRNYLSIDEAQPRSVVSPSQAEKLLAAHEVSTKFENKMQALITKPQGQPTLAFASDKRQEVKPLTAETEFSTQDDDLL